MKLSCRNYLPILIAGSQKKVLPVYIHFLQQNLDWANDIHHQIHMLKEVQRLILDNIEEIEKHSKLVLKGSARFMRLSGSDFIVASFSTRALESTTMMQVGDISNSILPVAHFELLLWIFPFQSPNVSLPTDELSYY